MRSLILLLLLLVTTSVVSQNELLAKNYFDQGEYEKAITLYEKIIERTPSRLDLLKSLIESYQQVERFDAAENLL